MVSLDRSKALTDKNRIGVLSCFKRNSRVRTRIFTTSDFFYTFGAF